MKRGAPDHPKMKKLARALNINRGWAVGLLESLWHWTSKFAPQGDIGKHEDVDIAEGCFWDREPSELINALIETGWIERCDKHRLLVHDWHDHADEAVTKRLARSKLPFLSVSRRCLDIVSTQSEHVAAAAGTGTGYGSGSGKAVETFENAMDRVPIQLREQVKADFARMVFDSWDQRDGRDGAGVLCRFEKLLQKRWNSEGEQWRNGRHSEQIKKYGKNSGTNNRRLEGVSRNPINDYAAAAVAKSKLAGQQIEAQNQTPSKAAGT
jgi:hypothetical protein